MAQENDELAQELKGLLGQTGLKSALDDEPQDDAPDNPLETDFFKAMNAFRAARTSGDREAMEAAERHLQEVVRGELTGEACTE
jgi:hypothetical protein